MVLETPHRHLAKMPILETININHHPLILNSNDTTKWIILWVYLFQDTYTLSQNATVTLLDFLKELFQSFDNITFSDFPSTIYRADKLVGIKNEYTSYIVVLIVINFTH